MPVSVVGLCCLAQLCKKIVQQVKQSCRMLLVPRLSQWQDYCSDLLPLSMHMLLLNRPCQWLRASAGYMLLIQKQMHDVYDALQPQPALESRTKVQMPQWATACRQLSCRCACMNPTTNPSLTVSHGSGEPMLPSQRPFSPQLSFNSQLSA